MKSDPIAHMSAMRRAVEGLAPDSQLARELEKVLDAASEQLGSACLRLAVAAEDGRGVDRIVTRIDQLGLERVEPVRVVLRRNEAPPLGFDAWALVASADQLGSLAEKELLERLGPRVADQVMVLILGMEKVPEDRRDDVLDFARSVFVPRGLRRERIVALASPPASSEEQDDPLCSALEGWSDDLMALRETALLDSFVETRGEASRQAAELRGELSVLDDAELLEEQLDEAVASIKLMSELLARSGAEVTERVLAALGEVWNEWRHEASGFGSRAAQLDFLEDRLATWRAEQLRGALVEGVRQSFASHLADDSPLAPALEQALRSSLEVPLEVALSLFAEDRQPVDAPSDPLLVRALRTGAPALGAILGFWRSGLRGMVTGVPIGLAVSELILDRLAHRKPGRQADGAPPELGETRIPIQIAKAADQILRSVRELFVESADEDRIRLLARLTRAKSKADEHRSKVAQLEALTAIIHAIDALNESP
jgi:hypothetical protein